MKLISEERLYDIRGISRAVAVFCDLGLINGIILVFPGMSEEVRLEQPLIYAMSVLSLTLLILVNLYLLFMFLADTYDLYAIVMTGFHWVVYRFFILAMLGCLWGYGYAVSFEVGMAWIGINAVLNLLYSSVAACDWWTFRRRSVEY